MKGMKFQEKVLLFVTAWIAIMAAEMSLAFFGGDPTIPIFNVIAAFLIVEVTDLRKKTGKKGIFK
jgi:hypothetical protein